MSRTDNESRTKQVSKQEANHLLALKCVCYQKPKDINALLSNVTTIYKAASRC